METISRKNYIHTKIEYQKEKLLYYCRFSSLFFNFSCNINFIIRAHWNLVSSK